VHDLLTHELDQIRAAPAAPSTKSDPAPPGHAIAPEDASVGERPTVIRHWLRRRRAQAAH
jgi:hypothetical protein